MLVLFRWIFRAAVLAGLLAVMATGLAYYFVSRSLPQYDLDISVAGLDAPVEIVRDNYAVPHIFGGSDRDVIFGLGFAHAQDRLWQMTLLRRTAQGRLSEIFGAETVEIDALMRALDIYGIAASVADSQRRAVREELQAYADGVNAYLQLIQDEASGRGAPEFFLFSNPIAAWTPTDSIAVLKLMALQLSDAAMKEVLRAKLSLRLPAERLRDIMPEGPGPVMELPEYASLFETLPNDLAQSAPVDHPLYPVRSVGMAGASNAWAAIGRRSAAGAPLLANDPHLGLSAPSIWMLARLEFQDGGAIGGTIPGLPGILTGRNADLAWGITSSYLDDQDIYIEQLNPRDSDEYLAPDGWMEFETAETVIKVKDAPDVTRQLRWTRHGPVIPAPHFGVAEVTPPGHVATLSWTGLDPQDRTIEAMLGIMRTRSVSSALLLSRLFVAPSQNLTLVDRVSIALQAMGKAPARVAGHNSQGRIPSAGWSRANDWRGYLPFDSNPSVRDPRGGIVVNTNNQTTDAAFPEHWSFDWGDSSRIQRAQQLLNAREFHTQSSFIEIQNDTVSLTARNLLPLLARDLWFAGEPAAEDDTGRRRQDALEMLAAWNGEMSEHAPEPLIFAAWVRALQHRLIVDELGALAETFTNVDPVFLERVFRDVDGAGSWCNIAHSTTTETCQNMARIVLDEALADLVERYGARMEAWRWGSAHEALHKHNVLGDLPVLHWIMNIRQETPGWDDTLMRGRTSGAEPTPFLNVHAAGFRSIVDFSDPESSVYIISTGQSGHVLSRHYDDLSLLWRRGEYIPMTLDPVRARSGAVGITNLRPEPR